MQRLQSSLSSLLGYFIPSSGWIKLFEIFFYRKVPNTELRWLPQSLLESQIRVLGATQVVLLGEFPDPGGKSDAGGGPQEAGPTAPYEGTRPTAGGSHFLRGIPLFALCILTAVRVRH